MALQSPQGPGPRSAGDTGPHVKHVLTRSSPQAPDHTAAPPFSCTDEDTEAEPPAALWNPAAGGHVLPHHRPFQVSLRTIHIRPGAQFRGGNSRWVSPWRTPPAHAALPEGGRSPKLRLNSQVLAHTLLLYQLIMGLPFPSDFLCHTRGPSKHPFTPHDTHGCRA